MQVQKEAKLRKTEAVDITNAQGASLERPDTRGALGKIDKALEAKRIARNEEFATCKPSRMLEMGMEDLLAVKRDPRYAVNMGIWHEPHGKKCVVCLAGSVMAKSLDIDADRNCGPYGASDGDDNILQRLDALDTLRGGYVESALRDMGIPIPKGLPYHIPVTSYTEGGGKVFSRFVRDMRGIIDLLKSHGL